MSGKIMCAHEHTQPYLESRKTLEKNKRTFWNCSSAFPMETPPVCVQWSGHDSWAESLVFSVVMLGGSRTFIRWAIVRGPWRCYPWEKWCSSCGILVSSLNKAIIKDGAWPHAGFLHSCVIYHSHTYTHHYAMCHGVPHYTVWTYSLQNCELSKPLLFLLHIFYWRVIVVHNNRICSYIFAHVHNITIESGQYHSPVFSL